MSLKHVRPKSPVNSSCKSASYLATSVQRPYDNWDTIMFDCVGQDFDTVMSALDSNNPRWGINTVTLVLQRPQAQS